MKVYLATAVLAILCGCASAPKPLALDASDRLNLRASREGQLFDANGARFRLKTFAASIEAGYTAPTMIDVVLPADLTMGGALSLCTELSGIKGKIDIHYPAGKAGPIGAITCN